MFGGAGGNAQSSHYICDDLGLLGPLHYAPRPSKRCLLSRTLGVLIHLASLTKKGHLTVTFFVWWSRGESNPRPQALYRQFYILSCVVKFNLRPRQRANIAQASYLRSRDMLSNPTSHISRVYDAAMACAIHPTGEVVQRPAGLSG